MVPPVPEGHEARAVRRRRPALLVIVGAATILAACGGPVEPARPASPFPTRPVSIDVSRLDPCSGMPPAEAEKLDFSSVSRHTANVNGIESPSCTWVVTGSRSFSYGAQTIATGAEAAAEEAGSRVIDIDGFGAVQGAASTNNGPGRPAFCQIAVDVADGQTLRTQVNYMDLDVGGTPAAIDSTCAEARRFTSAYLVTIRG